MDHRFIFLQRNKTILLNRAGWYKCFPFWEQLSWDTFLGVLQTAYFEHYETDNLCVACFFPAYPLMFFQQTSR